MLDFDKPKSDWDELDIYDREAANIRRALEKIDLNQWIKDLHTLDSELFERMFKKMSELKYGR